MEDLTYFLLTRKIFNSPIWSNDPHVLKLFIYLIGTARHSKNPKRYPNFEIKRGELVTSLNQIAEDNEYLGNGVLKRWSKQKVSRMLKLLVDQDYIKLLSDTYGTHISINHYDTYQDANTYKVDTSGTPLEQEWNTSGTGVGTNNNVNNVNNVKKVKKKLLENEFSLIDALSKEKEVIILKHEYFESIEFRKLFETFILVRKKLKAVNSESAVTSVFNKIVKYSNGLIDTANEIIQKSIDNSWKGVFELSGSNSANINTPQSTTSKFL